MIFSRKQQHVLIVSYVLFGIWLGWWGYCDIHTDIEASLLTQPDPPELTFYIDPPVDVNSAGSEELQLLPRIGPVLAERIIAYREEHGVFKTVESLMEVKRIGPKTVQKLQLYLTIHK